MTEVCQIIIGILGLGGAIKQYVLDPIKTLFRHNINIQNLRDEREKLNATRDCLQENIQVAKRSNQIIDTKVNQWLRKVGNLEEEITRILSHEPQDCTCPQGTCPNLKVRYSHSRNAMKLIPRIDKLIVECNNFGNAICHRPPRTGIETIPMLDMTRQFDSRKQTEEEIMSYLRDPSTFMIGVFGMGGLGKTTMATKIALRAKKEELFEYVVMAEVTQQVDRLKIQGQLAQGLDLVLTEGVETVRASELRTCLMNNKVLIILDNVWETLNIVGLGIPPQIKILLTTRNKRVCESMSTQRPTKILPLGLLNEEEAFSLFRDKTGSVVDQTHLRPIAMDVARECKGLPLALAIFGGALARDSDQSFWEAFLRQLQKSAPTNIDGGDLGHLYPRLELSYVALKSEEDKYLFLLCCLFPEDSHIEIEDLVPYVVGLPNFSATGSIIDARGKVILIVRRLVARSLLMGAGDESWPIYVKMHDVIRDMALSIASRGENKFKVSHDKGLREWPHESYTCISLTLGEAMTFQEGMHCPGLKALLLTFDLSSTTPMLPGNFLNGMADLTLLSINGEHPFSERAFRLSLSFLSSLIELRVLLLHNCGFEDTDISFLRQVKNLEILRCRGSEIQVLPVEIKALRRLKLLDMTDCGELKNIAPGVVSELILLEELRLKGCPIEWERQGTGYERRTASLAEVFSLKNLRILEVWIKDLEAISQKMDYSPKLTSYSIWIGWDQVAFVMEGSSNNSKRMSVCVDERMVFPDAISKLIEDVKELKLEGNGCKGIVESLGREGFENITSLEIVGLGDVTILVEPMNRVIFPNLRRLKLRGMNELEEICNGHPQVGSFSKLKEISIGECAKLKWVFPLSIAESLSKLESIYVEGCPVVEEVFNGHPQVGSFSELKKISIVRCAKLQCVFPLSIAESLSKLESIIVSDCPVVEQVFKESESGITAVNHVKFQNLKYMVLRGLPALGAWCKAVDAIIEFPSIPSLYIIAVSSYFKIFGNLQLADEVAKLNSRMHNVDMEIFYREVPIGFFYGVERLEIKSFHKLRVLFSLVVFKDLINLKELIMEDCKMLEYIVEMENEDEAHKNVMIKTIIIEKLEELQLSKLPKICYFWPFNYALEFPSLKRVSIRDCPMMGFAADRCSSNMPKCFGQQVTCSQLKEFFMCTHRGSGISPFYLSSWLVVFHIESSHNLKTLFSPGIFRALGNLWKLTVKDCMMLEDIVDMEKDEQRNNISKISHLKELELSNLPKIRYFGHFRYALEFPSLEKVTIDDCPKLETLVAELWSSSCLSSGSILARNFFNKQVTFTKLKELTMSHLSMEISPIGFFSGLETLHIESFDSLRILFSPAILKALGNLQKLTVKDCEMLEDIVEMEKDEQRNNISKISHLKELELSKLPKIRYFVHFSNAFELPSLEKVTIEDCPTMETFVVVSNALELPSLERVSIRNCLKLGTLVVDQLGSRSGMSRRSIPARNFFNKQVTCPKLKDLRLEGLKISGLLFSPETPITSLGALDWLKIKSCHNLKSLFTSRMFEGLTSLKDVWVTDCSLFEEVIAKDEDENENVDEMVKIPKLQSLELRELPKLRCFSHTRRDLELSSLQDIDLRDCTEIMKSGSFCLGGGSVRIPTEVRVEGILDPEFASQFFFPSQHPPEKDSFEDGDFMLFPSDLSFTWEYSEEPLVKGTCNTFFLVGWEKACGKFDMEKLSPGITYEIAFVIMLLKLSNEDDQLETIMLADEKREHKVKDMQRQQWMEILVGELRPSSGQCGEITFSLQKKFLISSVALKCAIIRPKKI